MNYYQEIQQLSPKQMQEYISMRIEELEFNSRAIQNDETIIGYELDYNLTNQLDDGNNLIIDVHNFYGGYIPKGTKIVYGLYYNFKKDGLAGNDGKYYYIDTDDYIYAFCKMIQDKEIESEFELFYYLQDFLKKYFGLLVTIDREDMFSMIYQSDKTFFKPTKEHGLSWFKGKGNAMCTEYAVVVQNILSFFGFDCYMMIGKEKIKGESEEYHAFNFISYQEQDSLEEINALIDFATPVAIYNYNLEYVGEFPFLGFLENLDEELINQINSSQKILRFQEHCYIAASEDVYQQFYQNERKYYVDEILNTNSVTNKNKIRMI